ncbi:MAG: ribosomal protection-like ABC-F family protein [Anaerolineales bacterium]|jgi:ATP-binding cassette subfamily F protein 3
MLTVHNISKSFNIKVVLQEVSFNVNPSDRVGLIGPNGSGKSTLIQIIIGKIEPDNGHITFTPPDLEVGYLPQSHDFPPGTSLQEYISKLTSDPEYLAQKLKSLAMSVTLHPEDQALQDEYDLILEKIEHFKFPQSHPDEILEKFNLKDVPESTLVSQLSGGQKTRLGLASLLIKNPDLLILDEPTNHLDIAMLEWLEGWLNSFPGGILIVSHDRTFLDNTVGKIIDLDSISHTIHQYQGNYSQYLDQYLNRQEKQLATYRDQVYEIRKMKQDIAKTKNQAYQVEITTTSREPGVRRYAKKVARKAKSREKKLERYTNSDVRVEKPGRSWQLHVEFDHNKHHSQVAARLENLSIGYSAQRILIAGIDHTIGYGDRIALSGPNGKGKTTLLRTISGEIEPICGLVSVGANIQLGYMSQEQEQLSTNLNSLETIQNYANISETEARSFLHYFLFSGDDVFLPVGKLSLGERSRLQLASLIIQGCDFLLLDEPINHLDIPSRTQFEHALSGFDGTVLAVVHDRYFIQRFASEIWILDNSGFLSMNKAFKI